MADLLKYTSIDQIFIGLEYRLIDPKTGEKYPQAMTSLTHTECEIQIRNVSEEDILKAGFRQVDQKLDPKTSSITDVFEQGNMVIDAIFPIGTFVFCRKDGEEEDKHIILFQGVIRSSMDFYAIWRSLSVWLNYKTEDNG